MLKWIVWGLQIASAGFAMLAAWLWWKSTKPKTPERVRWTAIAMTDGFGLNRTAEGFETFPVHSHNFDQMVQVLNDQSKWNRWAALAAAVFAVLQGIASLVPSNGS